MGRARNRHNEGEGGVAAGEPVLAASDAADGAATPRLVRTVGTQTPSSMERRRGGRSRRRQPKGSAERQKANAKSFAESPAPATAVLPDADALELPLDVVLAACRYLATARDVASALCVCKSWHGALVGNEELWSRLCADEWDRWAPVGHYALSPTADAPVIPGFGSWHAVFSVRAPASDR